MGKLGLGLEGRPKELRPVGDALLLGLVRPEVERDPKHLGTHTLCLFLGNAGVAAVYTKLGSGSMFEQVGLRE